ncbi:hypothetical protein [Chryseobacterium taklimakanense]|uniref:hypothetical protein n=1 Tax=Chryseobacterium taklimakanense TaxID=536441 RepID=UPI001E377E40|nr:hypothetical protein [Chryseobacterium taklimakanense]
MPGIARQDFFGLWQKRYIGEGSGFLSARENPFVAINTHPQIAALQIFGIDIRQARVTTEQKYFPNLCCALNFKFFFCQPLQFGFMQEIALHLHKFGIVAQKRIEIEPPVRQANPDDLAEILYILYG